MKLRSAASFGLGFAMAVILAGGAAYAANGGALILGRANSASLPTSLRNSTGTALALTSSNGKPSLTVNGKAKVANLNADALDGVDSTSFSLKLGHTGIIEGSASDGDGFVNTARCPTGTYATGGGGVAPTTGDHLWYSGPDFDGSGNFIRNSWFAGSDSGAVAFVECYNPRGSVPGAASHFAVVASGASSSSAVAASAGPQKAMPLFHK
jgi:hypothetical protein